MIVGNPGKAGGGGLICDHQGKWIKGYMRHIDVATSIIAEFWALRDGLMLASQLGITQLLVELDAKVIVDLVLSTKPSNNSYFSLLNDCRYLIRQFHWIKTSHVFREVNMCTNHLAKGGCTLSGNFVVLDSPPIDDLFIILNSDAFGMYSVRLLSTTSPFVAS